MLKFNKKPVILIALILVLGLGLFGCGKGLTTGNTNNNQNQNANLNINQNQNLNLNQKINNININQNTNNITTSGEIIDFNNSILYISDKYSYELKYPAQYDSSKSYSIWKTDQGTSNLLAVWGVNKFQETVFEISVYFKIFKDKILSYDHYYPTGEKVKLNSDIIAEKIDIKYPERNISANRLIVERGDYIYIIYSSFMDIPQNLEEYKEFKYILDNLKIK